MAVRAPAEKNFRRARVKPGRARTRARWGRLRLLGAGLAMLASAYAVYVATELVLNASVLQVRRITVHGNVRLSSGEVQALIAGLRGRSILTASLERYRSRLLESPWVADVALRRLLPSTIEVFVSERRPIGLCRLGTQLYLLDRDGIVIDEYGPEYAEFDLPIIDGVVRRQPRGEPRVDERRTALAARLLDDVSGHERLASQISQIDVSDLHDAVVLLHDDPARLHVGVERFAERLQQYVELAPTLVERVHALDYVDLRFEGRVIVRPTRPAAVQTAGRPPAHR